ncbi:FAD-dependent oxidoreductase [Microbacterium sp. NPDC058345]|uniref:FAD-dependent oxidoreductase n=1 Tax=Microbacterium sp. NPDC058345 TaxID=3346455 RepID=UPI0036648993
MPSDDDLIVIGSGTAGAVAAYESAAVGRRAAVVDHLPFGGTCALRGCDPKKILRRGAELIDPERKARDE